MSGKEPSTRVQQVAAARPGAQTADPAGPAPVEVGTAARLAASEHGRLLAGVRTGAGQAAMRNPSSRAGRAAGPEVA